MKAVHKTLAVLVYWSVAAVAYGSAECIHGDIRLRDEQATATTTAGGVEVCVSGSWTTVCHTGGWNSGLSSTENTRVACRTLGYRGNGATFGFTTRSVNRTATGLRQGMCSGSELQLIDCPAIGGTAECVDGVRLSCQLATCSTTIRLRGGRTATEGRVEVCRDGQWGTVCNDSWDRNDASVACRQLGLSNFNAVSISNAHFGTGSSRIHLSNIQCTGNESTLTNCPFELQEPTLTDCTFNTQLPCSHNQDASVICLVCNEDTLLYTSDTNTVEFCNGNMCNEACQEENGVSQLGGYICGSGEITHFLMNGSQLYECPISGPGEFLICESTVQTLVNNCQQVLQDIELQASSSSITVTWENAANAQNLDSSSTYEITCRVENSNLQASIVLDLGTSEVTMDNIFHSTTYECCVTLHIGRYSTRACGNTATLADTSGNTATLAATSGNTATQAATSGNTATQAATSGNTATQAATSGNTVTLAATSGNTATPAATSGNTATPAATSGNTATLAATSGNTATLAANTVTATKHVQTPSDSQNSDGGSTIQGVGLWVIIAQGVLVAVLVLLLVLVTGACLHYKNQNADATKYLSDEGPQLSLDPTYALPISGGSMAAKSDTEAQYDVVNRKQQQQQPDGDELIHNPAYSVHKTHPKQTNTAVVYETVNL